MSEKDILNKLNACFQTLQIYDLYREEMEFEFGVSGMRDLINLELDKINFHRKQLEELRKNKENNDEK